jgi:hypothetical protein
MKRFVRNLLVFALFSGMLFPLLLWIWGRFLPQGLRPNLVYPRGGIGHQYTRLSEAGSWGSAEVLVFGSSHAYRGFDPRIFQQEGLSLFNLGSSSQTPYQTLRLVQNYTEQFHPQWVILEVYPEIFASDGVESALDFLANDDLDGSLLLHSLKLGSLKVAMSALFAGMEQALNRRIPLEEPREKWGDLYVSGGYVERLEGGYQSQGWTVKPLTILPFQWEAFEEILAWLKKNNYPFLLVRAPVSPSWEAQQSGWEALEEQLRSLGPYWSGQEAFEWRDSVHFYDEHHLNQAGVEVFNQLLLERLKP